MTDWWVLFIVLPLAAYAVGAIPFGVLIARAHGVDLRRQGSGNVGATNVGRVLGKKWGYLCFLLDVGKGLAPVLLAGLCIRRAGEQPGLAEQTVWMLTALGAILGHVFSVWLKFRGGKGVATSLGALLGFWPYFTLPGAAAFALWIAVTLTWRYVSLGSIVAAIAFPVFFLATCVLARWPVGTMLPLLGFATLVAALVIVRHRSNIARLLRGTENKIGAKKPA